MRIIIPALVLLLSCPLHASAQEPAGPAVSASRTALVPTNYRVNSQGDRLLDLAVQEAIYTHGYQLTTPDASWPMSGDPAILSPRALHRQTALGERRLEMGLVRQPDGSLAVRLAGTDPVDWNDDLQPLAGYLRGRVPSTADAMDARDLAVRTYRLSYISADRAIAMLKALGYSTVEHEGTPGEGPYEQIYDLKHGGLGGLPMIVKFIDPPKTSMFESPPVAEYRRGKIEDTSVFGYGSGAAVPDIGGLFLHHPTMGDEMQRLMIVHDPADPEGLDHLLQLLRETIDEPARQVVVEALVIEVNLEDIVEIGTNYSIRSDRFGIDFPAPGSDALTGRRSLTFFDRQARDSSEVLIAVDALMRAGKADLLANPSVLVLDGRQARIQIGQQRPVATKFVRTEGTDFDFKYFPVGIVLNIKTRVAEEDRYVSMQVETIVSAVEARSQQQDPSSLALTAPVVESRQVQSFVRVADNTPFIVGGLIQHDDVDFRDSIPLLSRIPVIGRFLFGHNQKTVTKREVIVVLTPHIVPTEARDYAYLIPKDSQRFDTKGSELFRDTYRLRAKDVFDLGFVTDSAALRELREEVHAAVRRRPQLARDPDIQAVLHGHIPGEEVIVWKMLFEVIEQLRYADKIVLENVLYFADDPNAPDGQGYTVHFLAPLVDFILPADPKAPPESTALILPYQPLKSHDEETPFDRPTTNVIRMTEPVADYDQLLQTWNAPVEDRWAIVLHDQEDLDALLICLLLKEVIDLNDEDGLGLDTIKIGRQLLMPTETVGEPKYYIIERRTAEYFYKIRYYYSAFEKEFVKMSRRVRDKIAGVHPVQASY